MKMLRFRYEKQVKNIFVKKCLCLLKWKFSYTGAYYKGKVYVNHMGESSKLPLCLWQENLSGKDVLTKFHCM